jgi:hypothetical protein
VELKVGIKVPVEEDTGHSRFGIFSIMGCNFSCRKPTGEI